MGKGEQLEAQRQRGLRAAQYERMHQEDITNYTHNIGEDYDYYHEVGQLELNNVKRWLQENDAETPVIKQADYDVLEALAPPTFEDYIPEVQQASLGMNERKKYNRKFESYQKQREEWNNSSAAASWRATIKALTKRIERADEEAAEQEEVQRVNDVRHDLGQQSAGKRRAIDTEFDRLAGEEKEADMRAHYQLPKNPTPDMMDAAYEANRHFLPAERALSEKETAVFGGKLSDIISYTGLYFNAVNDYFRKGSMEQHQTAVTARADLFRCRMNRDVVTRRGVHGVNALAYMAGFDPLTMDPHTGEPYTEKGILDRVKALVEESKDGFIISDKSFVSTSVYNTGVGFKADEDRSLGAASTRGVEFMILVRKGTCAANVSAISKVPEENELLLAPGTRLRVIKVFFNEYGPGDVRKPFIGNANSVKIYLEALPPEDEGEVRQ